MFLAGHPNHQLVFMRIWQIEPTYLTDAFRDFYEENPLNITRILDVAQDLKVRCCHPSCPGLRANASIPRSSKPFLKSGPSFLPLMLLPLPRGENILI
jgi:CCR4-NOT transcription complex subunit 1 HEAT repeat